LFQFKDQFNLDRNIAMALQSFGGVHTGVKLEILMNYLHGYTHVLKKQHFRTVFFDAFAGTGQIEIGDNRESLFDVEASDSLMEGSASRALGLREPFNAYIFVEKARRKAQELEKLKTQFPDLAERISIECDDANAAHLKFCKTTNWSKTRAVVFLDPFGNHVVWSTLEIIARTRAIDLWYLFPAGLGVARQISNKGEVHESHVASLDNLLGTPEWRTHFIRTKQEPDLFGMAPPSHEKAVTANDVTDFMIGRMKTIFEGGVQNRWKRLGSRGVHMYSLIFACANPSPLAYTKAMKIAASVLREK